MAAHTIATVQAELAAATWIASSPATVQAELAAAVWIARPSTPPTTRGAGR